MRIKRNTVRPNVKRKTKKRTIKKERYFRR